MRRARRWFAGGATASLLVPLLFAPDLDGQVVPWRDDSPHDLRSVTVDSDVQLEILDWGGAGEPLVFLAGLTHNAHVFDDFAPRFTDRFRVIGITRRGHGNSSWPDSGYDLAKLVQDLEAALDSLALQRAFLAGHSFGGAEMTRFASENPDRVAGLIYIDAIQELSDPRDLSACPIGPELLEAMEQTFSDPEGFRQLQRRISDDGSSQANAAEAALAVIGQNSDALDYSTVSAPALAISYVPKRAEDLFLGVVDPSQQCVSAVQRMIFEGLANFARTMERGAIVALQDGNHNLHLVVPDEVAAAMRRWLAEQQEGAQGPPVSRVDIVHVAPPATDDEADRASILAAIQAARPGDTIQFAPGTYLIGEMIRVDLPRVTLLGHPDGTTLRGCRTTDAEERHARFACQGLELTGGHRTVRGLTFEDAHFALVVGCCALGPLTGEESPATQPGGYLIEDNTFRRARTGVRVQNGSSEPTVIRDNTFRNLGHAVTLNGGTNHVLDNDVSAPEPFTMPLLRNPVGAIGIVPVPPTRECGANIIAGNRIEGHPDGIGILVAVPGTTCRNNIIRNNTIVVGRVRYRAPVGLTMGSPSDSTIVGIPIAVVDGTDRPDLPSFPGFEGEAVVGDNVIEGNRIQGGFGLGIEIRGSSGNRVVNNTIRGIERREPFPGNTANSADPAAWQDANGSGIWVSAGSSATRSSTMNSRTSRQR